MTNSKTRRAFILHPSYFLFVLQTSAVRLSPGLSVHIDPFLYRHFADRLADDIERKVVQSLEADARLSHVELLAARLELGAEPLLRGLVTVHAHQVDRHVVFL